MDGMNMGGQGQQSPDPRLARMEQQRLLAAQQFAQQQQNAQPVSPEPVSPTPMPAPTPVAPSGNATSSMRERMRQSSQQSQSTQQVVLEQGENYNPQGAAPVEQPKAQTASSTIINTTNNGQVPNIQTDTGDDSPKFKLSKGMVLAIAAMVVIALVFILVMLKGSDEGEKEPEVPTYEDPFDDPNLEWLTPDSSIFYTDAEKSALRAAGYTGDEIDAFASQGLSASDKILQAQAERDAWIQEAIAPLYDTASDEYKAFISQTWLTLPERSDMNDWTQVATYYTERKNLDYEKVTVYGNQLFIKVYLDDAAHKDWFFLNVTPTEWLQLNDSGNVIVNYTYCTHFVGEDIMTAYEDTDNIYITSATLEIIQ